MAGKLLTLILLAGVPLLQAQSYENSPSRLMLAGSVGTFRISHNGFSDFYDGRSGFIPGAAAVVRIATPYHVIVKYHAFEKDGAGIQNGVQYNLQWEENWINAGLRYITYSEQKLTSYFGFGFSFFKIEESGPLRLFQDKQGEQSATGFFLDGGLDYHFGRRASIFFELEITSAGLEGKSGFEGSSVGGFFLGMGVNVTVL